ncbi:molybdopterin-binding protein [Zobellella endophytica]|uniref:Molybdopterin-binding protein n=1 Tax=Zobellella endophytica TaxID=2116700 RepID=A0A2P7R1C3_9GAMM|nr:molybdopterin-binding protein [Zobellella endophytica]PSJ44011.1 molybdopterin-binding protein [Zobellella endophytica]
MKLVGLILILLTLVPRGGVAEEPVILTVSGNILWQGQPHERLDYTLKELQAMPQRVITTSHPWGQQPHTYRGPDLVALMSSLFGHARIKTLYLEALNGYSISVDWQKLAPFQPVLAWQENGRVMSRREKGPLWLVLPFDQVPELQQADFLHFMTWQLRQIKVHTEPM